MLLAYPAIIHEDADRIWAEFPDLDGCTTFDTTLESVLSGAAEAMELYVLSLLEDGQKPPVPTDIKTMKNLGENAFATLIKSNIIFKQEV